MFILKILGAMDLAGALGFLMLIFGLDVFPQYLLFCSGLLLLKGMFILSGDVLSVVDIYAALMLLLSIFFNLFPSLLWIGAFLLMAKGVVSYF